jgi:hypothetical protein
LGLPGVLLHLARNTSVPDDGDVRAVELPEPGLVFGPSALTDDAATAFRFGRALGLLRQRASTAVALPAVELQTLFVAAGVIAGATPASEGEGKAAARSVELGAKALGKALARKEKKALALQASRFGFEAIDADEWQRTILRTADRLGLILSGDVAAAVRALVGFAGTRPAAELRERPEVVDLLRFALSEGYLLLRQQAGLARA